MYRKVWKNCDDYRSGGCDLITKTRGCETFNQLWLRRARRMQPESRRRSPSKFTIAFRGRRGLDAYFLLLPPPKLDLGFS